MLSENYSNLTPLERVMYIGELTHACMCDDNLFNLGKEIIRLGINKGIFDNVKIMPNIEETELNQLTETENDTKN
jgi:hypothetical protein